MIIVFSCFLGLSPFFLQKKCHRFFYGFCKKNGDICKNNGDFCKKNGDICKKNGDICKKNGDNPICHRFGIQPVTSQIKFLDKTYRIVICNGFAVKKSHNQILIFEK